MTKHRSQSSNVSEDISDYNLKPKASFVSVDEKAAAIKDGPDPVCETCYFWVRLNKSGARTAFGNCTRWQDVLVDNRGGVEASPLTPLTPELAACHEWSDRQSE